MSDAVVETTRTEINVEEVTETRFRCHVCEMVYDEDEVIKVGLDRRSGEDGFFMDGETPRAERTVCEHCADGLFGYETEDNRTFSESETPYTADDSSVIAVLTVMLLIVAIPMAIIAAAASVLGGSFSLVGAVGAGVVVGFAAGVVL